MYAVTTTPGFVIDSRPFGEAGKLLSIFTRDLGLVLATAQGIRLEKSKLRYHSQEYTLGSFSFVRGKEFWRLTSAGEYDGEGNVSSGALQKSGEKVATFLKSSEAHADLLARISLLLKRLLQGEDPHPELFAHIEALLSFLNSAAIDADQMKVLESVIVLRILSSLGYVQTNAELKSALEAPLAADLLASLKDKRLLMNQHINKALRESHL